MDFEKLDLLADRQKTYYVFDRGGFRYVWQYHPAKENERPDQWSLLAKIAHGVLEVVASSSITGKLFEFPCRILWGCPPEFEKVEPKK